MKTAAAAGQVEVLAPGLPAGAEFGLRVVVHATSRGPRQAAAVSETVVDGIIAAFHAGLGHGPAARAAAAALAARLPDTTAPELEALVAGSLPGPLFTSPAFVVKGTYVQISLCDDQCQVGEVTIQPDADGLYPQISGELFALRRTPALRLDSGHYLDALSPLREMRVKSAPKARPEPTFALIGGLMIRWS
jgi:hypothetical protein